MDQGHGNGMSEWDPESFNPEAWDHQFTDSGLAFDPNQGGDHSYQNQGQNHNHNQMQGSSLNNNHNLSNNHNLNHGLNHNHNHGHTQNPNAFIDAAPQTQSQIHAQLSGSEPEQAMYRSFPYFQQSDIWSGSTQTATTPNPYGHPSPLPQSYYPNQQSPGDVGRAANARFALVDPHLSHWQGQQLPSAGYGASPEFENPLAASHAVNLQPPGPRESPLSYSSGSRAVPGGVMQGIQGYEGLPRQSVDARQHQPQFAPISNGQPLQGRPSVAQLPVAMNTGSPRTAVQQPQQIPMTAQPLGQQQQQLINRSPQTHTPPLQPQVQPSIHRPIQAPVQSHNQVHNQAHNQTHNQTPVQAHNQAPVQAHNQASVRSHNQAPVQVHNQNPVQAHNQTSVKAHNQAFVQAHVQAPAQLTQIQVAVQASPIQSSAARPQPVQQFVQSTDRNVVSGVKRRPTSETPEPGLLAKKVRVLGGPINPGSPSTPATQTETPPPTSSFYLDNQALEEARGRKGGTLAGVPHLIVGETPVKLKKGPPTKRYVIISTKGDRDPLFPELPWGWTQAESLGNHLAAYQGAKTYLDRQKADARLEMELARTETEIPIDWWKKLPKGDANSEAKRTDSPPEPLNTAVTVSASLFIHPSHKSNRRVLVQAADDYYDILDDKVAEYRKNAPIFDKIVKGLKMRAKNPALFSFAEEEALRLQLEPTGKQLESAFAMGLKDADARVFRHLGEKTDLPTRILNVLIRHINLNDATSPLVKVLLRFFCRFTTVKRSKLESWKFPSIAKKLESNGDAEVRKLVAVIFSNADENDESDSSASDAKTAPSKTIESAGERKVSKGNGKVSTASLGSKRAREDDVGSEGRSSKKTTADLSTPGTNSSKATSVATKTPPATVTKVPVPKLPIAAPALTPTTSQAKARSGLLLPGKIRPAPKASPKIETLKVETPKATAKPIVAPKAQLVKTDAPKAAVSKPQPAQVAPPAPVPTKITKLKVSEPTQSGPSRFAALLAEIAEPKKVKAPVPQPLTPTDPDETDAQKERRLRKEARRRLNLKVTFRSDDRLVEIREFTRFPEEIGGRPGNAARDVDKMEGMALKKGHAGEIRPWEEPNPLDLEAIPQEARERAFVTRGGNATFSTEQQKFMEDREATELMVVYTEPSDIPPTPKSPPYEPMLADDNPAEAIQLPAAPEYDEVRLRARDRTQVGLWRAAHDSQVRMDARSNPDYADFTKALKSISSIADSYNGHTGPKTEARDDWETIGSDSRDQQTYSSLMSDRARNYRDPEVFDPARPRTVRRHDYVDAVVQKAVDFVEEIVEELRKSQSYLPSGTAEVPATKQQVSQPAEAAPDYTAAWAQYYAQQAQPQQQQQQAAWYAQQQSAYNQGANPYVQAQASQATGQQPNADAGNQLSAILSALGNQPAVVQPQYPSADSASLQALMSALAGTTQSQGSQSLPAPADPQNAEYLLSLMKWASGQAPAQAQASAAPAATTSYAQSQGQTGAPAHGSYGAQGYGQSHQDRDGYNPGSRSAGSDDRHHTRGGGGGSNGGGGWGGGSSSKSSQSDIPEHLRGINRSLIGTKQCTFWARGQCAKGDKCTFRHD
ncbi:hypothetical protein B0T24DRAFT_400672 [Lasiosphaeria ovina]|uniref:C3H1-type domain-containing protein n=1 Tax=Lasiosphaeria ovina TaxID=92902 RepID=A0AAE0JWS5_9PEZI|nr:hypothetical protein B0T24DRAFT_400672 [Lasiosphaeria ovina]